MLKETELIKPIGDVEFYRKLSLEDCKIKCDQDTYCNYFSHNIKTFTCKTFHDIIRESNNNDNDYDYDYNGTDTKDKTKDLICKRSKLITFIYKFCVLIKVNFGRNFTYRIHCLGCLHNGERREKNTENTTDPNRPEYCHCTGDYFGETCENDHKGNFNIDSFNTYYFSGNIFLSFYPKYFDAEKLTVFQYISCMIYKKV